MQKRTRKAQQKVSAYMQQKQKVQRLQALVLVLLHANNKLQQQHTKRKLQQKAA